MKTPQVIHIMRFIPLLMSALTWVGALGVIGGNGGPAQAALSPQERNVGLGLNVSGGPFQRANSDYGFSKVLWTAGLSAFSTWQFAQMKASLEVGWENRNPAYVGEVQALGRLELVSSETFALLPSLALHLGPGWQWLLIAQEHIQGTRGVDPDINPNPDSTVCACKGSVTTEFPSFTTWEIVAGLEIGHRMQLQFTGTKHSPLMWKMRMLYQVWRF